jgi:hypothetical protein
MTRFAQGTFVPRNADKYVGRGNPRYRSSWENAFFRFCDENPAVLQWASEAVSIKYRHPLTGKITNYVPDIFMRYKDQHGSLHTEIIEIKPRKQSVIEGRMTERDRAIVAINQAKWQAARAWCHRAGIEFRVLTEDSLFHSGGKKR